MNDILEELHKYSFENEQALSAVKSCGCFYCLKIFSPDEITYWVNDRNGKTALCPYCTIDSVIPESISGEYELNDELLKVMNDRFF